MRRGWAVGIAALLAAPAALIAQSTSIVLPVGTPIGLITVTPLSTKANVKGDMVEFTTVEDVSVDGVVVIPRGTQAIGQVSDSRAKGAMGMSGRLLVRPLYLRVGDTIVRLAGRASDKASVTAGAVLGSVALRAPFFTGRSAAIPAGTPLTAVVEKTVTLRR